MEPFWILYASLATYAHISEYYRTNDYEEKEHNIKEKQD
jgi:hypothetical protein